MTTPRIYAGHSTTAVHTDLDGSLAWKGAGTQRAGEAAVTNPLAAVGDPRRYGGVGDGVHDDSAAFAAALLGASLAAPGLGILSSSFYVPPTDAFWNITVPLTVPAGVRRMIGSQSKIRYSRVQSIVPTFADSLFNIQGNVNGLEVTGLAITYTGTFDVQPGTSYAGYISAFWVEDSTDVKFDLVSATGFNRAGLNIATGTGISGNFGYCNRPKVTRCNFSGNRIAGMLFGDTDGLTVDRSTFNTNGLATDNGVGYGLAGWAARQPKNTKITHNDCSFNYRKGIDFHSGTDGVISYNTCDGNYYYGIYVDSEGRDLGTWIISKNSIRNMVDRNPQASYGIYFGSSVAQGVNARATLAILDGNEFENLNEANGLQPIYLILLEVGTCVAAQVRVTNSVAKVGKVSRLIINAATVTGVAGAWHDIAIENNQWTADQVVQTPFSLSAPTNRVCTFKHNSVAVTTPLTVATVLSYAATVVAGNSHSYSGNILNLISSVPWANDPLLILRSASELTSRNQLNGVPLRDWDGFRYVDFGAVVPAADFWSAGSERRYNGTQAAGKITGWTCTVAGTPGTWVPIGVFPGTRIAGDSSPTQTVGVHAPTLRYDLATTGNRVVTLDATGAYDGAEFLIVRTVASAFSVDVGGLFTLRANETGWARVQWVGSAAAWKLMAFARTSLAFQGTRIAGDASVTMTVGVHPDTLRYDAATTGNRIVTLDTTNASDGDVITVVRTVASAFTIDVGGLKTIAGGATGTVRVQYVGSAAAWKLAGFDSTL